MSSGYQGSTLGCSDCQTSSSPCGARLQNHWSLNLLRIHLLKLLGFRRRSHWTLYKNSPIDILPCPVLYIKNFCSGDCASTKHKTWLTITSSNSVSIGEQATKPFFNSRSSCYSWEAHITFQVSDNHQKCIIQMNSPSTQPASSSFHVSEYIYNTCDDISVMGDTI